MTETQLKALQAAEDAFRRYADHHAMKGDETKARANMALAGQMSAAQVECAEPVAAQIRHQDEDGKWSEWAGIPLSHAGSNFLPSVQVRLLYEAGQLSPRMTGTDHAAELAHRTCSRYRHDQNPALVEYTFNQHTLGDFVQKLVAVQTPGKTLSADYVALKARQAGIEAVTPEITLFAELLTRSERAARREAQQRLADAQELAAKSGLAHRMAVHDAVAAAVAAEREACALICYKNWQSVSGDEIRARGTQ